MPQRTDARGVWLGAFVAALLLFAFTASPYPQWQDSGWQQIRILTYQLDHPLGLALYHPLHHFLGRAAVAIMPFAEPAYAITLVSAIAAAIAVANIAAAVLLIVGSGSAAFVAAAGLALAHTFWQQATHTESYTLFAALLTAEWLCLARYLRTGRVDSLMALAFFSGLGLSNHVLATLAMPVNLVVLYLAFAGRRRAAISWAASACWWLLGAMPYLVIIGARMIDTGDVFVVIRSALFGEFREQVLNTRFNATLLARSAGYVVYNFPNLTLPLAAAALLMRPALSASPESGDRRAPVYFQRVILAELAIFSVFVFRYAIADQYTFFVPVYCAIAMLAGIGLSRFSPHARSRLFPIALVLLVLTPAVYWMTARVLRARGTLAASIQGKPNRDGYRALLVPWGAGDDHAERLNGAALKLAGNNGVILTADPMTAFSLRYLEVLDRTPRELSLICIATPTDARQAWLRTYIIEAIRMGRPVILVPAHSDHPDTCFPDATWQREGDLYILKSLNGTQIQ